MDTRAELIKGPVSNGWSKTSGNNNTRVVDPGQMHRSKRALIPESRVDDPRDQSWDHRGVSGGVFWPVNEAGCIRFESCCPFISCSSSVCVVTGLGVFLWPLWRRTLPQGHGEQVFPTASPSLCSYRTSPLAQHGLHEPDRRRLAPKYHPS